MAKFLTLNTHSLLGENVEEKLKILGDEIFSGDYDVVCLQEVNQLMTSDTTQDLPGYCPVAGEIAIHEDNYGLQLARYLAQKGTTYYWSYAYNRWV
jgi:maltose 6'-phosphate phosphatase